MTFVWRPRRLSCFLNFAATSLGRVFETHAVDLQGTKRDAAGPGDDVLRVDQGKMT